MGVPGFWFVGKTLLGVGLVGVREAEPSGTGEFSKIFKKFLKKIANNCYKPGINLNII